MIRKIIGILFSVILVLCLAIPVYAEYPVWRYVEDLEAYVPLPSGMEYLTRDTEKNNPLLGKLGQTLDNVLADFNKNHVYFQLWKSDLSYMFNISMTASDFIDMK